MEQFYAMPALQRGNGGAGSGLRKVQRLRRAGDMLPFRNRDEDPKLLQGHPAHPVPRGRAAGSPKQSIWKTDRSNLNMQLD
jgi:hypothetical protein